MKRIILPIILIFSLPSTYAKQNDNADEICRMYLDLAKNVMLQKQSGMSISDMLDASDYAYKKTSNKEMQSIFNKVTMDAYKQPSYSTASLKREQVNEFSAKYYLGCMEMYESINSSK